MFKYESVLEHLNQICEETILVLINLLEKTFSELRCVFEDIFELLLRDLSTCREMHGVDCCSDFEICEHRDLSEVLPSVEVSQLCEVD